MRTIRLLVPVATLFGCSLFAQSLHPGAVIFPDETDTRILDWGDATVQDYLRIHKVPVSDQWMIRTYGRQDIYDNIKSFAWLKLMAVIHQAAKNQAPLSVQEQAVLAKFREHATFFRTDVLRRAVAEKNRFRGNLCAWKPDQEISQHLGYKYDGAYFCPKPVYVPPNQFGEHQPAFPPKEYFLAFAQKESWLKPIVARPGGLRAVTHIAHGGTLILAVGLPAAAMLGLALTIAIHVLGVIRHAIFPQEGYHLMGAVGVGISLAFMVTLIVLVIYLFTENERVLRDQDTLDTDLQTALAQPALTDVQLSNLLNMTKQGYQLLYITFLDMTVPKVASYSTAELPGPNALDPKFIVQVPGQTTTTAVDEIEFTGWSREIYRARMSGGWFFQKGLGAGNLDANSIGIRLQYRRNGVEYELSRHGRHFAIRKERPAQTDVDCPPDPATGLSSAPDLTKCRNYISTTAEIDLVNVGRRLISISQPIVFTSSLEGRVSWGVPSTIPIAAASSPNPTISTTGGLPAGFTFSEGIPGQGRGYLIWDGRSNSPALGDYNVSLRAEAAGGVALANLKINVVNNVRFTSPTTDSSKTYTYPAGQLIDMVVAATGVPASTPQLVSALPNTCGLTVTPSSNTLLLKGTLTFPGTGSGSACGLTFSVGSGSNSDTMTLNFDVGEPPSQPTLATTHFTTKVGAYSEFIVMTTGASGPVDISINPGWAIPSFMEFYDRRDGTALLRVHVADFLLQDFFVPLWYRVRGTKGNLATAFRDGVWIHIDKQPYLFPQSTMMLFTTLISSTYNGVAFNATSVTLSQPLPAGIELKQYAGGFSFIGTATGPADVQLEMTATNPYGTTTVPIRIICATPPKITSHNVVNFYENKPGAFTITTSGYPIRPLMGLELPGADMGVYNIDLAATNGVLPSGLQFVTKDPVTGERFYGYAMITGTVTNRFLIGNVYTHDVYITSLGGGDAQRLTIKLVKQGDVSGDGYVNCEDVSFITSRYGLRPGMLNYNYNADYNQDGVIDIRDMAMVSAKLPAGTRCN